MKAGDWVMWLNYFKDSTETISGVCTILSTGEPSLPFPKSPRGRSGGPGYHPRETVTSFSTSYRGRPNRCKYIFVIHALCRFCVMELTRLIVSVRRILPDQSSNRTRPETQTLTGWLTGVLRVISRLFIRTASSHTTTLTTLSSAPSNFRLSLQVSISNTLLHFQVREPLIQVTT